MISRNSSTFQWSGAPDCLYISFHLSKQRKYIQLLMAAIIKVCIEYETTSVDVSKSEIEI